MRKSALVQRRRPGAHHLLLDGLCLLALSLGLAGCGTVDNPEVCSEKYDECPDGQRCDFVTKRCMPMKADGGGVGGSGGSGGNGGGKDGPSSNGGDDAAGETTPDPTDAGSEAAGSCTVDEHCTADGLRKCFEGRCVTCIDDSHCDEERPWCSGNKTCETCVTAMQASVTVCTGAKPYCDTASARCSECQISTDCKDPLKPICGPMKTCVPCAAGAGGDAACAMRSTELPRCSATGGTCVACTESQHCTKPDAPICAAEQCIPCTTDGECATRNGPNPGLCLVRQAGRCARAEEVVYVKNDPGCSMAPGSGTSEMPACDPATGLLRTNTTRNIMLLRGPMPLDRLRIISGTGPLTVVGQGGATINPGAGRGIELTVGRDVYVQGLTVAGGDAEGVVVEGAGTLRLNRSIIKDNAQGGLVARMGAGYEIYNSVFDGNGPGAAPQVFGGVFLGLPGTGRQGIFRYNTVVSNKGPGVVCQAASQVLYGILFFDNQLFHKVTCDTPPGSLEINSPATPGFAPGTQPYRLGPSSPCKDMGHTTNFPIDDIDGQKRPAPAAAGARSDCGADEYHAP